MGAAVSNGARDDALIAILLTLLSWESTLPSCSNSWWPKVHGSSKPATSIPADWRRCCHRTPYSLLPGLAWLGLSLVTTAAAATPSTKMEWVATLGKAGWKHLGNFTGLVKIFSHELKYLSPNIIKSTYLGYLRQVFGLNRSEKSFRHCWTFHFQSCIGYMTLLIF